MPPTVQKIATRTTGFRYFALLPTFYDVRKAHSELLVGLYDKVRATLQHWALVDHVLPPSYPLILLENVAREDLEEQLKSLHKLGEDVRGCEMDVKLARAAYERHKRAVHKWMLGLYQWVWAWMQGTAWTALIGLVPGLGRRYQYWVTSAHDARAMWELMEKNPAEDLAGLAHGVSRRLFAGQLRGGSAGIRAIVAGVAASGTGF